MIKALILTAVSLNAFAQEHGHSHGSGGENEHLYPVLGIFAALLAVGAIVAFLNKKKK